jgi:hypothetical protein
MWGWLKAILGALFEALFKWRQSEADKPGKIEDAKTNPELRDRFRASMRDRLRRPPGSNGN